MNTPADSPRPPAPPAGMNRRRFLGVAAVAGLALVAVALAGPRRLWAALQRRYLEQFGPGEEVIVAALRADFAHLRLAEEAPVQFVRDYRAAGLYPLTLPLRHDVRVRFLLSTDFVPQRGDPAALVSYSAFYDPYASPCYNPYMLVPRDAAGVVI